MINTHRRKENNSHIHVKAAPDTAPLRGIYDAHPTPPPLRSANANRWAAFRKQRVSENLY